MASYTCSMHFRALQWAKPATTILWTFLLSQKNLRGTSVATTVRHASGWCNFSGCGSWRFYADIGRNRAILMGFHLDYTKHRRTKKRKNGSCQVTGASRGPQMGLINFSRKRSIWWGGHVFDQYQISIYHLNYGGKNTSWTDMWPPGWWLSICHMRQSDAHISWGSPNFSWEHWVRLESPWNRLVPNPWQMQDWTTRWRSEPLNIKPKALDMKPCPCAAHFSTSPCAVYHFPSSHSNWYAWSTGNMRNPVGPCWAQP